MSNNSWWNFKVTLDTPEKILDEVYRNKDISYKTYGEVGDVVKFESKFGSGEAPISFFKDNMRYLDLGNSVHSQQWVHNKYWIDCSTYNSAAEERLREGR